MLRLYEFVDSEGNGIEELCESSSVPRIGETATLEDGRVVMRVASLPRPQVVAGRGREHVGKKRSLHMGPAHGGHFASIQMPRWDPRAPRHDVDGSLTGVPGKCLFDNMRELNEACVKSEDLGLGKMKFIPEKDLA